VASGEWRVATPHRFFVDVPLAVGQVASVDRLAPQLSSVLRLKPGDEIVLLDGSGREYPALIQALSPKYAAALVVSVQECRSEAAVPLTLYQCSLKQDKFEWVLQKATELGVARVVPVISARSIVRPAEALLKKYDRWRTILREAAEQSRRGRIPVLEAPLGWAQAVQSLQGFGFVAWEEAGAAQGLGEAVGNCQWSMVNGQLSMVVGPEGGLTAAEVQMAQNAGWQVVSLGPRVLRAETAALAAVTIVQDRIGAFSVLRRAVQDATDASASR
jgi:16S rRNA (uracil1498-N3)-methyltransferase